MNPILERKLKKWEATNQLTSIGTYTLTVINTLNFPFIEHLELSRRIMGDNYSGGSFFRRIFQGGIFLGGNFQGK